MNTTRQDAWTQEEDTLLADTVLTYIGNGKTQLEAFKEVGKRLSRTSAACGFRWNASVRKQYAHAIQVAKQARKNKRITNDWKIEQSHPKDDKDPLDTAILLLKKMQNHSLFTDHLQPTDDINDLEKENKQLKSQLSRYEEAWQEMLKLWKWVQNNERNG